MLLCLFRCRFVWINATKQTNTNVNVDGTMHKGPTSHSALFLLCE